MNYSYIHLTRPLNCLLGSISVPIVMVSLYGLETPDGHTALITILGMLVVSFFTAGGNALNDYYDRDVDLINHPHRPIPSKDITPEDALKFSWFMFILSVSISLLLPLYLPLMIVLFSVFVMVMYELRLKKKGLVGNISIAWLTGSLFIFAGAIYGNLEIPIVLGTLAFLATLGRELAKDIQDMHGDIERNTLPMRIGVAKTKILASFFVVSAVAISPYPFIQGIFSVNYLAFVILANIVFLYALTVFKDPKRTQKFIKLGMMMALVAFLLGGII